MGPMVRHCLVWLVAPGRQMSPFLPKGGTRLPQHSTPHFQGPFLLPDHLRGLLEGLRHREPRGRDMSPVTYRAGCPAGG